MVMVVVVYIDFGGLFLFFTFVSKTLWLLIYVATFSHQSLWSLYWNLIPLFCHLSTLVVILLERSDLYVMLLNFLTSHILRQWHFHLFQPFSIVMPWLSSCLLIKPFIRLFLSYLLLFWVPISIWRLLSTFVSTLMQMSCWDTLDSKSLSHLLPSLFLLIKLYY